VCVTSSTLCKEERLLPWQGTTLFLLDLVVLLMLVFAFLILCAVILINKIDVCVTLLDITTICSIVYEQS
jgi:hypothetical protein